MRSIRLEEILCDSLRNCKYDLFIEYEIMSDNTVILRCDHPGIIVGKLGSTIELIRYRLRNETAFNDVKIREIRNYVKIRGDQK